MNRLDIRLEFEQWIHQYVDRLTGLAYTYLRDWAASEDAVQDAFIRAYQSRDQLQNVENPFPWLARIVVNQCRMIRRKTWREVITELLPDRRSRGAEDEVVTKEETGTVHMSIMALPESLRTPLYLYYFEEMPTKEIAHVMGISDGAVRIRLTRARERLAVELQRREENECRGEVTARKITISNSHRQ
jgi:RNA polymerase sigma-70 factor, ECF subfamily